MSISAMKQALEALKWINDEQAIISYEAVTALRQAIAEAEKQEPVAWLYDFLNSDNRDEVMLNWTTQDYEDIERGKGFNVRPLYTTPPAAQRQWVGLTDEEIMEVVDQITTYRGEYMVCVGNAIEAKLKEKNT